MKIRIIEESPQLRKRRVAAYCRVSTEHEEQEGSLENQIRHYKEEIRANPDYEYVDVYYDFGISGFKSERPGFQRMMADCRNGRIDLVITKSISRFARNTRTVLEATRELKDRNIAVYFELQGINTLTAEGELLMTIYAAFAQAESEGISALCKMAYQRKYEAGIPVQYLERSFGYRKNGVGEYEIDEQEGFWVRKAYRMIADGYTPTAVKKYMNNNGVKTVKGLEWNDGTVQRLIENVIYKGDFIMHKNFVNAERKLVRNKGEVDSWYVENDHVPIVSRSLWQKAQDSLARRREYLAEGVQVLERTIENYPYMGKVFCANCGHPLNARIYGKGNRLCWVCSGKRRFGKSFCNGTNVPDSVLREWDVEGNIYIYHKSKEKGVPEFAHYSESYWKRHNKKKEPSLEFPALNTDNYPYLKHIFCGKCGGLLGRYRNTKSRRVFWICDGYKRKGKSFCKGVRIPDDEIRKWLPIEENIYINERRSKDDEKRYSYSSTKPGQVPEGFAEGGETPNGGLLPGVDRPR